MTSLAVKRTWLRELWRRGLLRSCLAKSNFKGTQVNGRLPWTGGLEFWVTGRKTAAAFPEEAEPIPKRNSCLQSSRGLKPMRVWCGGVQLHGGGEFPTAILPRPILSRLARSSFPFFLARRLGDKNGVWGLSFRDTLILYSRKKVYILKTEL